MHDHNDIENVQCNEKSDGAVALVVMGAGLGMSPIHRKRELWVCPDAWPAISSPPTTPLQTTAGSRKACNFALHVHECWIVRMLETPEPVRRQSVSLLDPAHCQERKTDICRNRTYRIVLETVDTFFYVSLESVPDTGLRLVVPARDLHGATSVCALENNSRGPYMFLSRVAVCDVCFQNVMVFETDGEGDTCSHDKNSSAC